MTTNDLDLYVQSDEPISLADLLTADAAKALTDTIRQGAESVWQLIGAAYQGRAWVALGYESWDAYVDTEFGGAPLALPREKRKEAVASLKAQGMSLRAIAAATDTSPQTVANDLAAAAADAAEAGVQKLDTSVLTEEQHVRYDELTAKESSDDFLSDEEFAELKELRDITAVDAELVDEPAPEPVKTVGKDGKEYKAKAPKEPKPKTPKQSDEVAAAKRIAKALQTSQELLNDLITSKSYIAASKEIKQEVDNVLASPIVDLLEELEIRVPAKWMKLVS